MGDHARDTPLPIESVTGWDKRASLLSCGDVESNPGPSGARSETRMEFEWHLKVRAEEVLELHHIGPYFDVLMDIGPPEGPSGTSSTPSRLRVSARCVCGHVVWLRWGRVSELLHHVRLCQTLHAHSGRGEELRTCGDIEQNPGPEPQEEFSTHFATIPPDWRHPRLLQQKI